MLRVRIGLRSSWVGMVAVLATAAMALSACGGTKAAAPTTTTPSPLSLNLSATKRFFDTQGGGNWTPGKSLSASLYNEIGTVPPGCSVGINGPINTSQVELVNVTCAAPRQGSPGGLPVGAYALVKTTVLRLVPTAETWVQGVVNVIGAQMDVSGDALLTVGNSPTTLNLSIQSLGYRPPSP